MKNSSIGYIIGSAFRGMKKHLMMTTASVSVLIACMIIIGTAYLFSQNVSNFMLQIEQQNEIVAFIDDEYESDSNSREKLCEKVEAIDGVGSVEYITKEQAKNAPKVSDEQKVEEEEWEDLPLLDGLVADSILG